jgi:hypothetical protein
MAKMLEEKHFPLIARSGGVVQVLSRKTELIKHNGIKAKMH